MDDDDAPLDKARRIEEWRVARARRHRNPHSQPAQSSLFEGDIDPIRHPGSYGRPAFPDPSFAPTCTEPIRYSNPYSQPAQPILSGGNPDPIRRTNPYNQPPARRGHAFPLGHFDPSNQYSRLPSFSQGSADPYNPTTHLPFPHAHLAPHGPSSLYGQPTTHPAHYYQSNDGLFQPPNLSNIHATAHNSRNSFASHVTPGQD